MATAAVLLIKPDTIETVHKNIKIVNHLLLPPNLYKNLARTSKNPVFTSDLLKINIPPIVITAVLLNPEIAVSISMILNNNNKATANNAVTSKGSISKLKKTIVREITNSSII